MNYGEVVWEWVHQVSLILLIIITLLIYYPRTLSLQAVISKLKFATHKRIAYVEFIG